MRLPMREFNYTINKTIYNKKTCCRKLYIIHKANAQGTILKVYRNNSFKLRKTVSVENNCAHFTFSQSEFGTCAALRSLNERYLIRAVTSSRLCPNYPTREPKPESSLISSVQHCYPEPDPRPGQCLPYSKSPRIRTYNLTDILNK